MGFESPIPYGRVYKECLPVHITDALTPLMIDRCDGPLHGPATSTFSSSSLQINEKFLQSL